MTEQAINSSVLADWLQCATQMSNSFKAYRNSLPEGCTQRALASDLWARMDGASVNLDALRALVAEQEHASAGAPDEVDLAVKAAFERRIHAHSINVPCEEPDCALCKKRAAEQFETSPQFAVGDTVRWDGVCEFYVDPSFNGVDLTIHSFSKNGNAMCSNGLILQAIPLANLTLIAKEQA